MSAPPLDTTVGFVYAMLEEINLENFHSDYRKHLSSGRYIMVNPQRESAGGISWWVRLASPRGGAIMSLHARSKITLTAHLQTVLRRDRMLP